MSPRPVPALRPPARWPRRGRAGLTGLLLAALAGEAAAGLALTPCRIPGVSTEVQCGQLLRPLDPQRPQGPSITVQLAVLPATARRKRADPVVFFAGGPGQSAIGAAPQVQGLMARLNTRRDLIFIDARGTGRSSPLRCPDDPPGRPAPPLSTRFDPAAQLARLRACLAGWSALPHGDPRFFATASATADVEAVRAALGLSQLNLVGVSYGSRAALDYLQRHPEHVRRVVLDGVAPPDLGLPYSQAADVEAALDASLRACEQDEACARRLPALRAQTRALLAAPPRARAVRDPLDGRSQAWSPTPEALRSLLRATLYTPLSAAGLPQALSDAAAGRYEGLLGLASMHGAALSHRFGGLAEGPHFAVLCSEDFLLGRASEAAEPYRSLCPDWPRAPVLPEPLRPSAVPVLMLSGGVDPVTPPRHAARAAEALGDKVRHLVAPQHGHGVLGTGCARPLLQRFLEAEDEAEALGPALKQATHCLAAMPRPPVYLPPELETRP